MPKQPRSETEQLKPDQYEYFEADDETHECVVSAVVWKEGNAYCPTCGQPGTVYSPTVLDEVFRENDLSVLTFYSAEEGRQRVFINKGNEMLDLAFNEINVLIKALKRVEPIDLETYIIKVKEYSEVGAQPSASPERED